MKVQHGRGFTPQSYSCLLGRKSHKFHGIYCQEEMSLSCIFPGLELSFLVTILLGKLQFTAFLVFIPKEHTRA